MIWSLELIVSFISKSTPRLISSLFCGQYRIFKKHMLVKLLLSLVLIVRQVNFWVKCRATGYSRSTSVHYTIMCSSIFCWHFRICSVLVWLFVLASIGDTFTDGSVKYTMTSMNVPEPVMSLAVSPISKDSGGQVTTFLFSRMLY